MPGMVFNNGMEATYRLAEAPKFAGMREFDCAICGHETLRRPVFITDGSCVIAAGTRCAAIAMGLVPASAKTPEAAKALRTAEKEAHEAKMVEQRRVNAERDAEWDAFLNSAAGPGERIEQIRRLGGIAAAREAFKAA